MINGSKLRRLRKDRGWSTKDLADRASISTSIINDLENERDRAVTISSLTKISDALEIAMIELLPIEYHTANQAISAEEKELIRLFHSLRDDQRSALLAFLQSLC
ncbi:helix-turn-helix domain-containing protein [Paenibacillus taichungensis]|uniref:helix-turn-helix domain-containing protein n=1 Tax=Paenibacillus taichungensis TaxID=484184 RepID=UPI0035D78081